MKRMAAIVGILAVGALGGGLLGQTSGAQANTAQRHVTTSNKTLYAGSNLHFSGGEAMSASGSTTTVLKIAVTAPSAGMAAINFDSAFWTDYPDNSSNTSPLYGLAEIGRCSAPTTLSASACKLVLPIYTQKLPGATASDITEPYSTSALVKFTSGGTKTVYLTIAASGYPSGFYSGAHTQVAFTPSHPIATSSHVALTVTQ